MKAFSEPPFSEWNYWVIIWFSDQECLQFKAEQDKKLYYMTQILSETEFMHLCWYLMSYLKENLHWEIAEQESNSPVYLEKDTCRMMEKRSYGENLSRQYPLWMLTRIPPCLPCRNWLDVQNMVPPQKNKKDNNQISSTTRAKKFFVLKNCKWILHHLPPFPSTSTSEFYRREDKDDRRIIYDLKSITSWCRASSASSLHPLPHIADRQDLPAETRRRNWVPAACTDLEFLLHRHKNFAMINMRLTSIDALTFSG